MAASLAAPHAVLRAVGHTLEHPSSFGAPSSIPFQFTNLSRRVRPASSWPSTDGLFKTPRKEPALRHLDTPAPGPPHYRQLRRQGAEGSARRVRQMQCSGDWWVPQVGSRPCFNSLACRAPQARARRRRISRPRPTWLPAAQRQRQRTGCTPTMTLCASSPSTATAT